MKSSTFLHALDDSRIVEAIQSAEKHTTGEIRLVVSARADADPVQAGWRAFDKLKMHQTRFRNAVLIFLCPETQKFAILGDQGIHRESGEKLWPLAASTMSEGLASNQLTETLIKVIEIIGAELKQHFPADAVNPNELPDAIEREP